MATISLGFEAVTRSALLREAQRGNRESLAKLILPYAGFLVSGPTQTERLTAAPWNFWVVVVGATVGNTVGSLIGYAIGAWGGRPFLERYGRYLLIRPHELELAEHFFERYGSATAFFSRLLPIVRTFISFPAGVARMPLPRFIAYSTAGAFFWSAALVYAGVLLGARWQDIRHALQPFDLLVAIGVIAAIGDPGQVVVAFLGRHGDGAQTHDHERSSSAPVSTCNAGVETPSTGAGVSSGSGVPRNQRHSTRS